VNVPGTAEGELIEVPPFGLIPNGSTIVLDEEQLDAYEVYMQYLSGDPEYEIEEDIMIPPPAPVEVSEEPGPDSTPSEPEPEDGE
jgi:hypothetical protein